MSTRCAPGKAGIVGRNEARCPSVRLPMPPVSTVRATFTAHGARSRDFMVTSISPEIHRIHGVQLARSLDTLYRFPPLLLRALPKPRCRHLDSATKPDMNVSVHPAPQQRGVCHTYLGNQSLWLFSYRDNVDATVACCLSHPSRRPFWVGCDRLPSCPHP